MANLIATHQATLNGETIEFNAQNYDAVVSSLVSKHGGGVPQITPIAPAGSFPAPAVVVPEHDAERGAVSASAAARAKADEAAAKAAGFSPNDPIYEIGTRVIGAGSENARRSRREFDDLPLARDAFNTFADQIKAENRRDRQVTLDSLRMDPDGTIQVKQGSRVHRVAITERAFKQLVSARIGIGGGAYLAECWPELRAFNVNSWIERVAEMARKQEQEASVVLRVRSKQNGEREIFAAVTEKYQGGLDAERIARSLALATPPDARGSVSYDGARAKFETLFHSDVNADEYCAGEIFKAGAVVRTDDMGGGSIRTAGTMLRNLCLNLYILDNCEKETARVRHMGDLDGLTERFELGFQDALQSVEYFRRAWGFSSAEKVVDNLVTDEPTEKITVDDLLAGIFWAQLRHQRELVPVVRGNRKAVVKDLVEAVKRDEKRPQNVQDVTRATVVNAWTRYAHEGAPSADPWLQDSIERAATTLLPSKTGRVKPLMFESFPG